MTQAAVPADFWYQCQNIHYPVMITRRKTSRRLSIRFDPVSHAIRVSAPLRTSKRQVETSLQQHGAWLEARIAEKLSPVPFLLGNCLPIEGQERQLQHDDRPRHQRPPGAWRLDEHSLIITGDIVHFARRSQDALKDLAAIRARQYIDRYCAMVEKPAGRITMRDTGSRWGSCTAKGDFNLSWRLIFAPAEVFDYVAAHEAAHLIHRDHSAQFWQVVDDICPQQNAAKTWLKHHGSQLFRYGAESLARPE